MTKPVELRPEYQPQLVCELCESPVHRRFKMGSLQICAWCLRAIADALVHREEKLEKERSRK